jgi:hypothetical protein
MLFLLQEGVVITLPNHQDWILTLVGCPQLLIQHIQAALKT